jgi:hypothetical protein
MGRADLVTRQRPPSCGLIRAFPLADEAKQSLRCFGYAGAFRRNDGRTPAGELFPFLGHGSRGTSLRRANRNRDVRVRYALACLDDHRLIHPSGIGSDDRDLGVAYYLVVCGRERLTSDQHSCHERGVETLAIDGEIRPLFDGGSADRSYGGRFEAETVERQRDTRVKAEFDCRRNAYILRQQ